MGFTKADRAHRSRIAQHQRIRIGDPIAQQMRPRLGDCARGIKQVLPADRHPVQRRKPAADGGASARA